MTAQPRIALIEDSPENAEVVSVFLSQLCDNVRVRHFPNGLAFLEAFQRGFYTVVILDISLPGLDGYEVLRRMRSIDPDIPVIAFTAHADRNSRQRATEAGFNDFVTKPVHDMEAFCRTILKVAGVKY
jgi:CheY-like chemotaxis protein